MYDRAFFRVFGAFQLNSPGGTGGNLEVAYKHQNDGITVFRTDMHENQLEEKRREVAAGHAKRIDPHLVSSPSLSVHSPSLSCTLSQHLAVSPSLILTLR